MGFVVNDWLSFVKCVFPSMQLESWLRDSLVYKFIVYSSVTTVAVGFFGV